MKLDELEDELRLLFAERAADVTGPRPAPPRHLVDAGAIAHTTEVESDRRRRVLVVAAAVVAIAVLATTLVALRPTEERLLPAGPSGPLFVLPAEGPITQARMFNSLEVDEDEDLRVLTVARPVGGGALEDFVQIWIGGLRPTFEGSGERTVLELANVAIEAEIGAWQVGTGYAGEVDGVPVAIEVADVDEPELRSVLADVELSDGSARLVDGSDYVTAGQYAPPEQVTFATTMALDVSAQRWVFTGELSDDSLLSNMIGWHRAEPIRVRGRDGWLLTSPLWRNAIRWQETDRHYLQVSAPVEPDELAAFVEELRVVEAAEWLAATGGVLVNELPAGDDGPLFLLPQAGSTAAVSSVRAVDDVIVRTTWQRHRTYFPRTALGVADAVTIGVVQGPPRSGGEPVSIRFANRTIEFVASSPIPDALTVLEAPLGEDRLVVRSPAALDELTDVLAEIIVDADGWSRSEDGSRFGMLRSRDDPVDDIAVAGTEVDLVVEGVDVTLTTTEVATQPRALLGDAVVDAELISVLGRPAWTATTDEGTSLAWRETQRQSVLLSGDVPLDTLLRVATDLEEVDPSTWLAATGG
ncbi:MAG: hypothetical protein AAFZ07_14075 [Actinomycetota bacterium]